MVIVHRQGFTTIFPVYPLLGDSANQTKAGHPSGQTINLWALQATGGLDLEPEQ